MRVSSPSDHVSVALVAYVIVHIPAGIVSAMGRVDPTAATPGALFAVPADIPDDGAAHTAAGPQMLGEGVVQVVQQQQGGVLGPAQGVELVVAVLTHLYEGVARIHEGRGQQDVWVRDCDSLGMGCHHHTLPRAATIQRRLHQLIRLPGQVSVQIIEPQGWVMHHPSYPPILPW